MADAPLGKHATVERLPDRAAGALRAWERGGLIPGARIVIVGRADAGVTVALADGRSVLLDPTQASEVIVRD